MFESRKIFLKLRQMIVIIQLNCGSIPKVQRLTWTRSFRQRERERERKSEGESGRERESHIRWCYSGHDLLAFSDPAFIYRLKEAGLRRLMLIHLNKLSWSTWALKIKHSIFTWTEIIMLTSMLQQQKQVCCMCKPFTCGLRVHMQSTFSHFYCIPVRLNYNRLPLF